MGSGQQSGKGGGARKYGNKQKNCDRYKKRDGEGKTPKMRRIAKRLENGEKILKYEKKNARWVDAYVLGSKGQAVRVN